jgi:hypothetical protein
VIRIADFACHCAANCGDWIDEGEPYRKIAAGGDRPTAYIHPDCVDRYKQLLAAGQKPVRNAPQREADFWEATCERCGQHFAERGPRDALPDRCPVPACVLREGLKPAGPGDTCGGRLVPVGEDLEPAADSVPCADCGRPSGADPLVELTNETPGWLRRAFERYRPVCPECALKACPPDHPMGTTGPPPPSRRPRKPASELAARTQVGRASSTRRRACPSTPRRSLSPFRVATH